MVDELPFQATPARRVHPLTFLFALKGPGQKSSRLGRSGPTPLRSSAVGLGAAQLAPIVAPAASTAGGTPATMAAPAAAAGAGTSADAAARPAIVPHLTGRR